jgi:hypothetical protein
VVAAGGLAAGEVDHVPEEPADRSPQDMQNTEPARCAVRHLSFTLC